MPYETLLFDVSDNVATITLNRPDSANALNEQMSRDLMHASIACDEDPSIRAVLLTGTGRFFSAGGDLKSFAGQGQSLSAGIKEMVTYFHGAISRFRRMDPPMVAAVNGTAAGAGMSMACSCDIVLAAESARFTMAYTAVGLVPDGSSTYFLPRIVGVKRATELAITNRALSAQEAADWGIVSRVLPDDQLMDEARSLATRLAAGATFALGAAKRLMQDGWTETLETQMELEGRAIADAARTEDVREGITAFIQKRTPKFKRK
jgi:2-(1,2-epoxy-1,2-dihydrophenyl)acetyl-CoA isomerase